MDQVSGRRPKVSRDGNNIQCGVCIKSGQVSSVLGFCQNCNEYLCSNCIIQHSKFPTLEGHIIKIGDDMPRVRPTPSNLGTCSKHPGRTVEMFCFDDNTVGCTMCFVDGHARCQKKRLISEISNNIKSSDDMIEIQAAAEKQKVLSKQLKQIIKKCRLTNDQCHSKCLEDYKCFRAKIEAFLDKLKEEVTNQAVKMKKDNTEKLDSLAITIASYEQQVQSFVEEISGCSALNLNDQLFIAIKKNKTPIIETVQKLEQFAQNIHIQEYEFAKDPSIEEMLDKHCRIRVRQETRPVFDEHDKKKSNVPDSKDAEVPMCVALTPAKVCTAQSKIFIKSKEDTSNCGITGMLVLSRTKLILTDFSNSCLKLVDTTSGRIKRRSLASNPHNVTRLPGSIVAVTLPRIQQIEMFTADDNMDPRGSITVTGQCKGIHCIGDRIIVTFDHPEAKVQILDMKGQVLHSIQHDSTGAALFARPFYITASHDNRSIYVSDFGRNALTCITTTGTVRWVYKSKGLTCPNGVVTGDCGCLYICSWTNHTVHVVSADGDKLGVIPERHSGIDSPSAAGYSSIDRILYVSCNSEDTKRWNFISRLALT